MKTVGAVEKALNILNRFSQQKPEWSLAELARELELSKPTILRLLNTLEKYGYVSRNRVTRKYRLGMRLFDLVGIVLSQIEVRAVALPVMREIMGKVDEAVYLNVISGEERVCIEFLDCSHTIKASVNIGQRSPLYVGASALVLLAFQKERDREKLINGLELKPFTDSTITSKQKLRQRLEEIRRKGYAVSWGERNAGLVSLSVPVFDRHAEVAASLSIGLPDARAEPEKLDLCVKLLLEGGKAISRQMGCRIDDVH
ncbi:MAG TPA: IclR family transcriptional regulator [Desulfotomaculum sp.]|nr:IclR family transcriptional regulator [Desulfofundulus thermobenzoicus]HHW43509.1 IclR family transcriptional regulator [Desulfotomaculum sp.]